MSDSNAGPLERVEEHLRSHPPQAQKALQELEAILKQSGADPRANLYVALALSMVGEKEKAATFAKLAVDVANNIAHEATELLKHLPAAK